jgi:hypothetical protein
MNRPISNIPLKLRLSIGMLTLASYIGHAATLVDDTFADGNRTSNPVWYWANDMNESDQVDSVSSNEWTVGNSNDSSNSSIVTYFTPTLLGSEETITFSFDFSYSTLVSSGSSHLRFGLFNSEGTQITADGSQSQSAFNNDIGYASFYSLQTESANYDLMERTGGSDKLWSTTAYDTSAIRDSVATTDANTLYRASIALTRTLDDQLIVTSSIDGNALSFTYDSPSNFTFDMISIYTGGANGALSFSNLVVRTIPEPATTSVMVAAMELIFVGLSRGKRSQR